MSHTWRVLSLPQPKGAAAAFPPLLISTAFTSGSYTIRLTDLTHIWIENLDRRAILRRSLNENTSIDPSDGADQLQIFLEKIELALRGGKDTALTISVQADDDVHDSQTPPTIVLSLTVDLPGGLAPLKWRVYLKPAPQSALTSQLVVPIIKAQNKRMHEMVSLVELLKEKDHVIQRLVDRLEAQGTELGQIFPHAVGKLGKKFDRKKADERVKGLGSFGMDVWRRGLEDTETDATGSLVETLFSEDNAFPVELDTGDTPVETDHWWEAIKGKTIGPSLPVRQTAGLAPRAAPKAKHSALEEEQDDFQVQSTPPHLAGPKSETPKSTIYDSTDDEDDDLDAPTQGSKVPDSYPVSPPAAAKTTPKKLGKLGSRKAVPKSPSPPPQLIQHSVDDGSTTEDDEPVPAKAIPQKRAPSPKPTPTPSPSLAPAKRGKFGKIGSKKQPSPRSPSAPPKSAEPESESPKPKKRKLGAIGSKKQTRNATPTPEPAAEAEKASPASGSKKRKLGDIGHGKKKDHDAEQDVNSDKEMGEAGQGDVQHEEKISVRGRERLKKEETPEIRETSEERADRKRAQLKRDLEAKAKAPVKKKKKF